MMLSRILIVVVNHHLFFQEVLENASDQTVPSSPQAIITSRESLVSSSAVAGRIFYVLCKCSSAENVLARTFLLIRRDAYAKLCRLCAASNKSTRQLRVILTACFDACRHKQAARATYLQLLTLAPSLSYRHRLPCWNTRAIAWCGIAGWSASRFNARHSSLWPSCLPSLCVPYPGLSPLHAPVRTRSPTAPRYSEVRETRRQLRAGPLGGTRHIVSRMERAQSLQEAGAAQQRADREHWRRE